MTTPQPLVLKFLRYFDAPSMGNQPAMFGLWLRLLYEFWGFCVNGSNDLRFPGGFPTGSTSTTFLTGVINMPVNWESGSTVLLYSNSDGSTVNGLPYFTGSNFLASHVGKWLTTWKSGSSSTDDGIYLITKLYGPPGTLTSSVIGVDINMGGTPFSGNLKPSFTDRTNVNYRIIDYSSTAVNTTYTTQNFIVLQLNGAPYVNLGQANSQVKLRLATFRGDTSPRGVAILLSPSGSWGVSGSSVGFNEGLTGGNSLGGDSVGASVASNIGEFGPNSGNSFDWANGGNGTQCINIIAAQDYFNVFSRGAQASYSSGFHVEIPQRLYPFSKDPNPITGMGHTGLYTTFTNGYGYGYGFHQVNAALQPLRGWLACHHQTGDDFNSNAYPGIQFVCSQCLQSMGNGFYNNIWFNPFTNKFSFSDAIYGTTESASHHTLARFRIRRARFIAPIIPSMQRLGDRGEWLHTFNGVLWPWDNAVMPGTIFHQGG